MKITTKKRVSVCLSFILVLGLFYTASPANSAKVAKAAGYGLSNPRTERERVATWDCIYFGNYWQSDTNGDGEVDKNDEKQPIKWRVLSVDGDDAFLLADQNLDYQPYNEEETDVTWETCTLREWLNNDFYQNAFDSSEQSAIRTTNVVNEDNPYSGTEGGNNTSDKVYLLSIDEASNVAYGFCNAYDKYSETREAKNTAYTEECGAYTESSGSYAGNGWWWLRSPGSGSHRAAYVSYIGSVYGNGGNVGGDNIVVRPALHLNLSSSKWSKADTVSLYSDVATWDCIYFGNYWQNDTNGDGKVDKNDEKQPIKWRVLSVDGDDAFLLADQNLDCQPYNEQKTDVTWETCTLREWLNNDFYQNAFDNSEQSAVRTTNIVNEDNPRYGTEGGNNTSDKVYLLSIDEASNAAYGFCSTYDKCSETRETKNTAYAEGCGDYPNSSGSYAGNGEWWLRSPGDYSFYAAYVISNGYIDDYGYVDGYDNYVDCFYNLVRPALHLNLSSTKWSKAGTVSSSGEICGGETAIATATPDNGETQTPIITLTPTPNSTGGETIASTPTATPTKNGNLTNPRTDSNGETTWDCIYFGNYWQNDTNGDGKADKNDVKQPIKWRVLSVDGDDAFVLADQNLDCQPYNKELTDVTWETCTLRQWLNSDFYLNAFDSSEQSAVRTMAVENEDNPEYGTEGGNNTSDQVYLLSIGEVSNTAYGFHGIYDKESETREAKNTEYAKECGSYTNSSDSYAGNGYWWLRSPGCVSSFAETVYRDGSVDGDGDYVGHDEIAVRPALHLNLLSSKWSKAGTVSASGEVSGGETAIATATPDNGETETPIVTLTPAPTEGETTTLTPTVTPNNGETETPTVTPTQDADLNNPRTDSNGETIWDCIYFGNYWQNDTNGDGKADKNDAKQPIKWRVLSVDGDDAFLLADQSLDCQPYNEEYMGVTWETCTLRQWLNSEFYQNAFDSSEQSAVWTTAVVNENNPEYVTEGGNNTSDQVYLLSSGEANNIVYGFHGTYSETREAKNTEYAKERGADTASSGNYAGNGYWWLRSPGSDSHRAAYVGNYGFVHDYGSRVDASSGAVRPALHLDLSSLKWSKAGTVSVSGAGSADATATPDNGETSTPTVTPNPTGGGTTTPLPTVTPDNKEEIRKPQQPENKTDEKVTPLAKLTSLKAINKNGKKISLSWKKIKDAKGYQIQYADNKKWKKKKSKWTKKTKYTIKKLKKKKTYYIRVRAYNLDGSKKVYGSWSKVKKVKVKK